MDILTFKKFFSVSGTNSRKGSSADDNNSRAGFLYDLFNEEIQKIDDTLFADQDQPVNLEQKQDNVSANMKSLLYAFLSK